MVLRFLIFFTFLFLFYFIFLSLWKMNTYRRFQISCTVAYNLSCNYYLLRCNRWQFDPLVQTGLVAYKIHLEQSRPPGSRSGKHAPCFASHINSIEHCALNAADVFHSYNVIPLRLMECYVMISLRLIVSQKPWLILDNFIFNSVEVVLLTFYDTS